VTVSFADQQLSTTAKDGKWMVRLGAGKGGRPYKMTIAGSNTVELSNILVGEVWVCSGQSNMEFGLKSASNGAEAIAAAPTRASASTPCRERPPIRRWMI